MSAIAETKGIANQLKRSLEGVAWHGPSIRGEAFDEPLGADWPDPGAPSEVRWRGVVQHNLDHAGQIAILKKLQAAR